MGYSIGMTVGALAVLGIRALHGDSIYVAAGLFPFVDMAIRRWIRSCE